MQASRDAEQELLKETQCKLNERDAEMASVLRERDDAKAKLKQHLSCKEILGEVVTILKTDSESEAVPAAHQLSKLVNIS